ncbi:MAG: NAD(P)/FAD-dependent oxidoreductase [Gemmatimonadaceae bacterium]|nr:NAD(P)/FAD-dependent oxidoreductase [Gemmatimonadaceae bacterium]NUQ92828.1 NAD(P)/FAD-dependent oxidoreductase [Gemmatimonadaceae bacterium]NUR33541.1 NAD(P)/FAD-dependent oxidoreductase [Gemmatimonadaceae bacterium]NUS96171.1 NAD(P)/FAD-dependent oxidoreductase [Gemmatimonadaceae bacterium]
MAIRLLERGIDDFVVLERAREIGGTWRDNSYPGCACDVESHLYSFSFALNPDWSRSFSSQPEILDYLRACAERFGVTPHVRLGCDVRALRWEDDAQRWRIESSAGVTTASVVVVATGPLSDPIVPELPGIARFEGKTFHSAQWDHAYDLAGKRVAVLGTGASAVQFVPEIQKVVAKLDVYQRTPPWILPRPDRDHSAEERRRFRRHPLLQRLHRARLYLQHELFVFPFRRPKLMERGQRMALRHLKRAVADPALRAKLTPRYTMGCKRILLSNDYLPALARANVEVITAGVREVRERSIVDGEGVEREVDAIIYATGFRPTDPPLAATTVGRDGRTLIEAWEGSPKAYMGTTVAGFPNLFMLLGPNTGLGHSSVVYMIEAQIEHVLKVLRLMERRGLAAVEPRAEAQRAFVSRVDSRMRGTVWTAGGCASWYLDGTGRNSTLWPDFTWRFHRRVSRLRARDYAGRRAGERG